MDGDRRADVADLLARLRAGDREAGERLFEVLHEDLRAVARSLFRSQRRGHTLQATALVNEAYLKFAAPLRDGAAWQDRAHFLAVASRAMRQVLQNHGRARGAAKRGGAAARMRVTVGGVAGDAPDELDALDVHAALDDLAALDSRQAAIAEMKYYAGLTHPEIAEALGVSVRTVEVDWSMAKRWLRRRLG